MGREQNEENEEQKLTVCRHARTRPKWICGSAAWVGNELCHKTRGIRGFILFHSILHGRQPPREYGIKLLRRLTEDDEIVAAEKAVVDIGKFPRSRGRGRNGSGHWGDTFRITKWRARATIKYRLLPIHMRARISYVPGVRQTEFDFIALRMPIRPMIPFVKATPSFASKLLS